MNERDTIRGLSFEAYAELFVTPTATIASVFIQEPGTITWEPTDWYLETDADDAGPRLLRIAWESTRRHEMPAEGGNVRTRTLSWQEFLKQVAGSRRTLDTSIPRIGAHLATTGQVVLMLTVFGAKGDRIGFEQEFIEETAPSDAKIGERIHRLIEEFWRIQRDHK